MSPTRKKVRIPIRFLALLPFILILAAAGIFVLSGGSVSVEDILNYTPDNPVLAAIVLILALLAQFAGSRVRLNRP